MRHATHGAARVSDLRHSFARVIVVWVLVLGALYLLQEYFA
jgi:hypothetical protein